MREKSRPVVDAFLVTLFVVTAPPSHNEQETGSGEQHDQAKPWQHRSNDSDPRGSA